MNIPSPIVCCQAHLAPAAIAGNRPVNYPSPACVKSHRPLLALLLLVSFALAPLTCRAVPSFARQTGLACIACHTEFPELNAFGRQFKLTGFTLALQSLLIYRRWP